MTHINSKQPRFSIITICFNAEKEIERTLNSVSEQSYAHIEYIIVDGKSTDGTLYIVDKFRPIVSKQISEPDKGLYEAMNKGIQLATGDYLCFLNAGDMFFSSTTLQEVVDGLKGTEPDVIYGNTALVDDEGSFLRMRRLSPPQQLTWKSFKQGMLVCHQAFMPKRELAPLYDLNYRFSSDFDWCIRILKNSVLTHNTNTTLIKYLNEGVTTRNHKASLQERYQIMESHYGKITTAALHLWFALRHLLKK